MINKIIQDANENNKELWLLSQDLGKAYDRVNIFILKKAMKLITAYGLTDPYDVLIEQCKLGYTIEVPKIALNKFYGENTTEETESLTISSSAYMDDTQWLASNQSNLENIFEIADFFYRLNDIQVNKEKFELLVIYKNRGHRSRLKPHELVTLKFSSDSIFITPVSPQSSIRILGIYFDERNAFQSTIKRINDEINDIRQKYVRKRITDKHMIYIFNSVIIPRIVYWSQVKDQVKITNLIIQLNDLSTLAFLPEKIVKKYRNNFLIASLNLMKNHNISLINNSSRDMLIPEGQITLLQVLKETYFNHLFFFKKYRILFLDQILSDDSFLLSTDEIRSKFNIPSALALRWYRKIVHVLNINQELLSLVNSIYNSNFKICPIVTQQFSQESEADRIRKNYTSKLILINTDNYPKYYIDTPKKNVNFQQDSFSLEHYNIELTNNNNKLQISRCLGCDNTTSYFSPLRLKRDQIQESYCNITCKITNMIILYTGSRSTSNENKHRLIPVDINSHLHQIDNRNSISSNIINLDVEALYIIQQHLQDEDNLTFFTDSSLINTNTQAVSMIAGFIRISDINTTIHTFITTVENWPSSLRAELFAILAVIIISPHGCHVDINTDSQNSINIIQQILKNPTFSIRDYFRISNNNLIINNIISIIRSKNLCIRFNKVQAHSDNYFNNQIDLACKLAYHDNTLSLTIKQQFFNNIRYIPQWGHIPIERKF
ncbi:ribonuclease H-like domain-containing protein [Rhizophagus clarus]|uniref:Ribonuclease H-like domain-containing protein n=1 Tax=Rhizophagus clarus TaxID=94130 RepID=A0A8H3LQP5_9GLOM|nr:ribonuclease H-like domain-containing protein [Rhizophagus clarus]